jgi:single stranded DNA-binding protein
MPFLNEWTGIGNVVKDPEMRYTKNGKAVTNFTVATNEYWKDEYGDKKQESEFTNVTAWDFLAEFSSKYLKRGSKVLIKGRKQSKKFPKDCPHCGQLTHGNSHEVVATKILNLQRTDDDNGLGESTF